MLLCQRIREGTDENVKMRSAVPGAIARSRLSGQVLKIVPVDLSQNLQQALQRRSRCFTKDRIKCENTTTYGELTGSCHVELFGCGIPNRGQRRHIDQYYTCASQAPSKTEIPLDIHRRLFLQEAPIAYLISK